MISDSKNSRTRGTVPRVAATVGLAMLAVFAGGPAMADGPNSLKQAQSQGQQPKGDPSLQSKSDEDLHRELATEKDPARQQAIQRELSNRISDGYSWENLPDDPYTGGSLDIPLGDWAGVTIGGGINSQWGLNLGGGAYAGTPRSPSVGKVSPRPDGLNAAVDLSIPLGNGSLSLKGSLNLNTLNGSATGSYETETTPGHKTEESVTVTFSDGKMEVTKKDGTKVDLGGGASLSLDSLSVDKDGKVEGGGSLSLGLPDKDKEKAKEGPWGKRPPSISLRGQLTADKSYRTFRELLEGLGILSKPGTPTPAEVEEAKKRWAEAQAARHKQQNKQQNKPVQPPQPAPSKPATPPQPPAAAQPPAQAPVQQPPVVLAPPATPPDATQPAPPEAQPPTQGQDPAGGMFGGHSSDHDSNSGGSTAPDANNPGNQGSSPPDAGISHQNNTSNQDTSDPGGADPSFSGSGFSDPGSDSSAGHDSSPPDADASHQNNTSNQDTSDPGGADPSTSDPGRSDPEASDPSSSDTSTSDPGSDSSAGQDSSPPDADASHQNNTSNQDTSDPGGADPSASDPGQSDPEADPGETDPGQSGGGYGSYGGYGGYGADDSGWGGCACF